MNFGVQLYGPLNNMQGEVSEKLSALAKAGITEIEPCMTTGVFSGKLAGICRLLNGFAEAK